MPKRPSKPNRSPAKPGPRARAPSKPSAPRTSAPGRPSLLIVVVTSKEALQDVVTTLLDLEIGGTVVDCKGLLSVLKDEMPIFGGLAATLPARATGSRMVLSLTSRKLADRALRVLTQSIEGSAVAFSIGVDAAIGIGAR